MHALAQRNNSAIWHVEGLLIREVINNEFRAFALEQVHSRKTYLEYVEIMPEIRQDNETRS